MAFENSEAILRPLKTSEANGSNLDGLQRTLEEKAETLRANGQPQEATAALKESINVLNEFITVEPENLRKPKLLQTLKQRLEEWEMPDTSM